MVCPLWSYQVATGEALYCYHNSTRTIKQMFNKTLSVVRLIILLCILAGYFNSALLWTPTYQPLPRSRYKVNTRSLWVSVLSFAKLFEVVLLASCPVVCIAVLFLVILEFSIGKTCPSHRKPLVWFVVSYSWALSFSIGCYLIFYWAKIFCRTVRGSCDENKAVFLSLPL